MSVVPFPKPPPGNGAREAMIEIMWKGAVCDVAVAPSVADAFLAALWRLGFKVVPCGVPTPNDPAA